MAEEMITCKVGNEKDWTVFAVAGRLDKITSPEIGDKAEVLLMQRAKLAMDVKGLSYISSAGIRILFRLAKKAKANRKSFAICGARGFVKEVMEDANVKSIVSVYDDRNELG